MTCDRCKTTSTLTYGLDGPEHGRYHWQAWDCPKCAHKNGLNLAGKILKVKLRID